MERIPMNGSPVWSQEPSDLKCSGCGKPVDLSKNNTLIEPFKEQFPSNEGKMAWHQQCFDRFLDEGEEV
jgi:hypothetical protein